MKDEIFSLVENVGRLSLFIKQTQSKGYIILFDFTDQCRSISIIHARGKNESTQGNA
jgi:hypothetical protein